MTRDTKLALVVGFALVLAVGVLISDHFASGYQSPPADLVETKPAVLVRDVPPDRAPDREARGDRSGRRGASGLAQDPPAPRQEQAQRLDPPPTEFLLGNPEFHDGIQENSPRSLLPHERAQREDNPIPVLPLADLSFEQSPQDTPVGREKRPSAPVGSSGISPEPRWHTVAEGESLWEICEHYYGKGSLWTKLAELNADRVGKEGVVREGVRLRIPEPVAFGLADRKLPEPRTADEPAKPANVATRNYTVGKSETLSEIAAKQLGSAKRMNEIVKLNGIEDPDEIRAGMVLRLPM